MSLAERVLAADGSGILFLNDCTPEELCSIADNVHIMRYIDDMDNHLMAADVVVSRAGALSIAEICVCGK